MTTEVKTGPTAFESRVTRDKTGTTIVFMKSPMLEDVFSAMAAGKSQTTNFSNGAVAIHEPLDGSIGSFNRSVKVYTSESIRFSADATRMYWTEQPLYDGGPSICSLAVVGLRNGISWRIEQPMTVDALKKYAQRLREGVRAILESVRPVEISLNVPLSVKKAG